MKIMQRGLDARLEYITCMIFVLASLLALKTTKCRSVTEPEGASQFSIPSAKHEGYYGKPPRAK